MQTYKVSCDVCSVDVVRLCVWQWDITMGYVVGGTYVMYIVGCGISM
jgi:hypothetical protein